MMAPLSSLDTMKAFRPPTPISSAAEFPRILPCGHLGLRSRQHPLPAHLPHLAAGRRAHHALYRQHVRNRRPVGPGPAEIFLPQARHDPAGADRRVRHRPVRLPRFRARYRPRGSIELNASLGEAIERLPGRKLILTNGSRKHAENVARKTRHSRPFRGYFRHRGGRISSPSRTGAPTRLFLKSTGWSRPAPRCSRISPRTWSCPTSSA